MIALTNNFKRHQKLKQTNNASNVAFKSNAMDRITDSIAEKMPKIYINTGKDGFLQKFGNLQPFQQRAIIGLIELGTQPFVDWWSNRKESKDTRKCSLAKTLAKILAGALVGIGTRWGTCIVWDLLVKHHEKLPKVLKLPNELIKNKKLADGVKQVASIAMTVITMFTVDLPLTNFIINSFLRKFSPETCKKTGKSGGCSKHA